MGKQEKSVLDLYGTCALKCFCCRAWQTVAVDKDGLNFLNNQTFFGLWFFNWIFFLMGGAGVREGGWRGQEMNYTFRKSLTLLM